MALMLHILRNRLGAMFAFSCMLFRWHLFRRELLFFLFFLWCYVLLILFCYFRLLLLLLERHRFLDFFVLLLMLDLCIKVSKGEELWNLKTNQCDVLYLALEDTHQRLQKRLCRLTDEIGSNFHIAIESNKITNGLVMQLEQALKQY